MNDRIIPIKRSNLTYLATLPEDCQITSMCEWNGFLYLTSDSEKLWQFNIEKLEFIEIKPTP